MKTFSNKVSATLFFILCITSLSALTGCSNSNSHHSYEMAPLNALSEDLQAAPEEVREAYQFAIANQELLKNFPCYCGCGGVGHENNLDCYIQEVTPDGTIIFENHAFGWTICVDITRDVMRLLDGGKSVDEIRTYIDDMYREFGPSNMEPSPWKELF